MKSVAIILTLTATLHAAPERILLWPTGAPGAKGTEDRDQPRVELYRPQKPNGAAVVVCPGGGYGGLAADHEGRQPALYFNSLGVTAYVLYYRLGSTGYRHPIPLGDAQRALRTVRSRAAADGIDPARVGVMGFSAGGHLAATAGTHFDSGKPEAADAVERQGARPDWMVLCYPVASFDPAITHRGSVQNLLGEKAGDAELINVLSNEQHVSDRTPPTFLFHTTEDSAVPVENSLRFYEALKKHHVPCELHVYQNGVHGVGLMQGDPVLGTWPGHLSAWLRDNGFFAGKIERAAVSGTVTINGKPASWATLCFTPADPALPVVTARVRNGNFALTSPAAGPVTGRTALTVTLSGEDCPEADAPAGVFTMTEAVRGSGQPLTTDVSAQSKLKLDLVWRK